jgi:4-hydroxybenzoyl-CoA thioesterase
MPYTTQALVRFAHVDPAGIVFYPRYFEMLNGAIEDWFAQRLGLDFATMHLQDRIGVPTVKLDTEFVSPSRLGDDLQIGITPWQLGRSSCSLLVVFACAGVVRLRVRMVLVCMDLTVHKARAWPEAVRAAIATDLEPV